MTQKFQEFQSSIMMQVLRAIWIFEVQKGFLWKNDVLGEVESDVEITAWDDVILDEAQPSPILCYQTQ